MASPAGAHVGFNQSVDIMASGAHYLDNKVAVRKPIPRNLSQMMDNQNEYLE